METNSSVKIFREMLQAFHLELEGNGVKEYSNQEMQMWMLHQAHQLMRMQVISKEEFADIMDEVICW